jgi:hypothetical protein
MRRGGSTGPSLRFGTTGVVCERLLSFRTREARRNLLQPLALHAAEGKAREGRFSRGGATGPSLRFGTTGALCARDCCRSERAKRGGICCSLSRCMRMSESARRKIAARGINRSLASLRDDRRVVCGRSLSFRTREARRNLLQPLALHAAEETWRERRMRREGSTGPSLRFGTRGALCARDCCRSERAKRGGICCNLTALHAAEGKAREGRLRRGGSTGPSLRFGTTGVCVQGKTQSGFVAQTEVSVTKPRSSSSSIETIVSAMSML